MMRWCPRFKVWSDGVPALCRPIYEKKPCRICELPTLRNRFASWLFSYLFKKPEYDGPDWEPPIDSLYDYMESGEENARRAREEELRK